MSVVPQGHDGANAAHTGAALAQPRRSVGSVTGGYLWAGVRGSQRTDMP